MVELSYEELDRCITEISTAQRLAYVETVDGSKVPVLLKYPTSYERMLAEHYYKETYKEAEAEGLPSVKEMEVLIKERGIFSPADEKKIEELERRIKSNEAVLAKTTRVPARRDRLQKAIADIKDEISQIEAKKNKIFELTRERKAAEAKLLYLAWTSTYDVFTREKYWPTYEEFQTEKDFVFRKLTYVEFVVFFHGVGTEKLRFIARSNLWRLRYVTATKTGNDLFDRPLSEYTSDQLMLLYWSHYYQSIYEMLPSDRPSEDIIEDDAALDAFMKEWNSERNRQAAASKAQKKNKSGNQSAWDHGEVLVMKSNEMYKDIEYSETPAGLKENKNKTSIDDAPINKSKQKKRFS